MDRSKAGSSQQPSPPEEEREKTRKLRRVMAAIHSPTRKKACPKSQLEFGRFDLILVASAAPNA